MSLALFLMVGGGYLAFKSKRLLWKIVGSGMIVFGFIGFATLLTN